MYEPIKDFQIDVLYATNKDGEVISDNSISVTKGIFNESINSEDGKTTGFKTENVDDAKAVYKFAADNNQKTDSNDGIEFGYVEYDKSNTTKAAVVTDGESQKVGATKIASKIENDGGVVSTISHSHPSSSNPSRADITNAGLYPKNSSGQSINRTVYLPAFEKVINYNEAGIIYDENFSPFNTSFFK